MKPTDNANTKPNAYMFNVDLLVRGESNALAMERLLHALNRGGFADFRIKSGIGLGRLIQELETNGTAGSPSLSSLPPVAGERESGAAGTAAKEAPAKPPVDSPPAKALAADSIKQIIRDNRLIRLSVNKGFGVRLNLPCRIINFDDASETITAYHVDEKQVYSFRLNEIDDFTC
ncbi:hypothetical protein [Paenibacillus humicola]|uniref:hypothetical protein n=1 Tax=Paenibacillus humicola TaxID=3110540 RepID=UPI00237A6DD8|nr:hypothetical protein [Paenibacillus humicola]